MTALRRDLMAPRSLASLAHALGVAPDMDASLTALAEAVSDVDRSALVALVRYDGRRDMLRERSVASGTRVETTSLDLTYDHFPTPLRSRISAGGQFIDFGDRSAEFARLLGIAGTANGFGGPSGGGQLAIRGLRVEGHLSAVLALYEPRKIFGTRASERAAPAAALFDLAFARMAEREAREEAVRTLEDVTQRVHGEYVRKLGQLEGELRASRQQTPAPGSALDPAQAAALQGDVARSAEEMRRALRRADRAEDQLSAAIGQLEQAHVELHRRNDALRQRTRTLYLLDRVLSLDAGTNDPKALVDGLLALVGEDMQAQRCSLMLRAPEPDMLFLAAARGIAPHVYEGKRIAIGEGVAGKVAAARQPILVQDVKEAAQHPLLRDQFFTTGSFISFPLIYHEELVGVLNLTNRQQRGIYLEDDVERVRLLGLVISLVASQARLPERLAERFGAVAAT
jgi:putative methionine-R-sulfoxide reductase with GAF domain